jgi:hypothetical protein
LKLLDEIVELATNNKEPLGNLLRKCLVLATKLNNGSLKTWALKELNGYDKDDELPSYRVLPVHSYGNFYGPFGSSVQNRPLPSMVMKEQHRELATTARLYDPVAGYEQLLENREEGSLSSAWPPDLILFYQSKFIEDFALVSAWRSIPTGAVIALVDTIRTRVLTFALEIEGALDRVGDNPAAVPKSEVNNHVTNIFYGGNNVVSGSTQGVTQIGEINVSKGDIGSLVAALEAIGLRNADVERLKQAITEDQQVDTTEAPGPKTSSWLTKTLSKVGGEGLKVSADVARSAITAAVLGYFGLS